LVGHFADRSTDAMTCSEQKVHAPSPSGKTARGERDLADSVKTAANRLAFEPFRI
jgi:hypothetical protein